MLAIDDIWQRLTVSERAFLEAMRDGESGDGYARRINYSRPWAEWMRGKIRYKLGVERIGEAVKLSEYAGLESRFNALESKLDSALEKLTQATTPKQERDARADINDLLASRGLTTKDLDALADAKFSDKIDARVAAVLAAREEEAARLAAEADDGTDDDADDDDGAGRSGVQKVLDGLGGIKNVKPS